MDGRTQLGTLSCTGSKQYPGHNRTKGTWLVDHRHQLLLDVTGVYPIPGCKLALKTTQLDNIYLDRLTAKEMQNINYGLSQMLAREVDMQMNTALAID